MKIARISALAVVVLAAAAVLATPAAAMKYVQTRGGIELHPNQALSQTQRFVPGTIYVKPNGFIRWVDADKTVEPHTVMAVRPASLPKTVEEIFSCAICANWKRHLADPSDETSGWGSFKVDYGRPGFQTRGDSLLLLDRSRIGGQIRAPAGTVIRYMCAFHPWMQGTIRVTRTGKPRVR